LIRFYYPTIAVALFLIGCMNRDPGDSVNHVHVGSFIVDLTFGPVTTLITFPFILWGVKVIVTRILKKRDEEAAAQTEKAAVENKKREKELEDKKLEAIRLKAQIEEERHDALQQLILDNRDLVSKKLDRVCERFEQQEARFRKHGHTVENGRTKDIIITLDV
jgi:flagellar biosynthesis component FlhA